MVSALVEELGFNVQTPHIVNCDNNSAVLTYQTEVPEWRTNMLGTRYYRMRDYTDNGVIKIVHVEGVKNNADIHTKPLCAPDHYKHMEWLGLYDATPTDQEGECGDPAPAPVAE